MMSPSPSTDPTAATFAAIEVPSLTLPSGETVTATRLLPFREGRAFIKAMASGGDAGERLDASLGVLRGMGFPEAVEELPLEDVVKAAVRFFTESCQRSNE